MVWLAWLLAAVASRSASDVAQFTTVAKRIDTQYDISMFFHFKLRFQAFAGLNNMLPSQNVVMVGKGARRCTLDSKSYHKRLV